MADFTNTDEQKTCDTDTSKPKRAMSKERRERFTWHPGDLKFISQAEFDQMVRDGKAILYGKPTLDAGGTSQA